MNYQESLHQITRLLMRFQRPQRLLRFVTRQINQEFQLTHTSLLVFEEDKGYFTFVHSRGDEKLPLGLVKIESSHPLIQWFQSKDKQGEGTSCLSLEFIQKEREHLNKGEPFFEEDFLVSLELALKAYKAELAVPAYDKKSLDMILLFGKKQNGVGFNQEETSFFQTLAHVCAMALKSSRYHEKLARKNIELQKQVKETELLRSNERETYHQILRSLAQEVYAKDPYTYGHVNQVERLGMMTAEELGLDLSESKKDILSASLILHDLGKIGIPDHILQKPARLDNEEWAVMQTHVIKGVKILEQLDLFKEVADIVHCHHERYDGSGYPRGLKEDEIPIESKIISVVDAYHAIISKRSYDPERPIEVAFQELEKCSGTQFDPTVVRAFVRAKKRQIAINKQLREN